MLCQAAGTAHFLMRGMQAIKASGGVLVKGLSKKPDPDLEREFGDIMEILKLMGDTIPKRLHALMADNQNGNVAKDAGKCKLN